MDRWADSSITPPPPKKKKKKKKHQFCGRTIMQVIPEPENVPFKMASYFLIVSLKATSVVFTKIYM